MTTISKISVHLLCSLLQEYGIRHIVVSSGSRCAPLSVAFSRSESFTLHPVIDERSAGFFALGMALALNEPVAMLCTSGSAPLNYAPALAEAYYRRIPLIAITADRPEWSVDQREGQTIRQSGALDAVVRCSVDIRDIDDDTDATGLANRLINQALTTSTGKIPGPVQINMRLDAPLTEMCEASALPAAKKITTVHVPESSYFTPGYLWPIANPQILLAIGGVRLKQEDLEALNIMREKCDIAVIAEVQSNIPEAIAPMHCDMILNEAPTPDVVAVVGGDFISNRFKGWLRKLKNVTFISGGYEDRIVDTFSNLDTHIECSPANFFRLLSTAGCLNGYDSQWKMLARRGILKYNLTSPAVRIFQSLADSFNGSLVHVSNGSSARIAQLVEWRPGTTIEINRGVSGIDGSTSTAIGAAKVSASPTLLISGDMSAAYDIGALATIGLPNNFKMAVLDNEGGDIFRNIPTTAKLPELDDLFVMKPNLPLQKLSQAYGLAYFECSSASDNSIPEFINHNGPAILRIIVAPEESTGLI